MVKTGEKRKRSWSTYLNQIKNDANRYIRYKEKDKVRKRNERKNKVVSSSEAEQIRQKCKERVRLHRFKKKLSSSKIRVGQPHKESDSAYKSAQALGKATGKVKSCLPASPRKKVAVIRKLADSYGIPSIEKKMYKDSGNKQLPQTIVKCIQDFYIVDSISSQAPGMRDYVIVRSQGKKTKLQKRHLIWSLKETHAMFKKENADCKIGLSKFSSLRPCNVLLSSKLPRTVCLCQQHENIRLLCDCLWKEITSFPQYSSSFVDAFVCDSNNESCMTGKCKTGKCKKEKCTDCPDFLEEMKEEAPLDEITTWYQWERVTKEVPGKKGKAPSFTKKMEKVHKEGTVEEALQSLGTKMSSFLKHVFIKRNQARFFQEKINNLKLEEAVVQFDFSENYTCLQQDEIQSAYYNQEQVTLFTVAVWTKDSSCNTICTSHVIVSDDRSHEKKQVAVFVNKVLNTFIKEYHPSVNEVHMFSDGPSSQFKNKFIAQLLDSFTRSHHLRLFWHYFATSHGKGAVDGIGGSVKRMVWTAVSTRKVQPVINAKGFADVAKGRSKTSITLITSNEISKTSEALDLDQYFKKAKAIPGISKFHCMFATQPGTMKFLTYSYQKTGIEVLLGESDDETESDYSGEVECCSNHEDDNNEEGKSSAENQSYSSQEENNSDDQSSGDEKIEYNEEDECCSSSNESNSGTEISENADGQNILIQPGLPDRFKEVFSDVCSAFVIPEYNLPFIESIVAGDTAFDGNLLISRDDLTSLHAVGGASRDKWLVNFVIDSYLELVKSATQTAKNLKVISWEVFDQVIGRQPAGDIVNGKQMTDQDIVLVPINTNQSKHWFLLAAFPKQKCIITLDSMSSLYVKPTVQHAVQKMMSFLVELDSSIDVSEWEFFASTEGDLPQQNNEFDCGVFVCLFSRCLALGSKMVSQKDIPSYRKHMILELHQQVLHAIPPNTIPVSGNYYAVDYINIFYIGRLLEIEGVIGKFKFLHRVGATTFDWPRRDDLDSIHMSCIFFGPVQLQGYGPFQIAERAAVEKAYQTLKH